MKKINIDNQNYNNIQAYIEYRNIVGNDDKGKLMSPEEYEKYKQKVSNTRKNHLYISWINSAGIECKTIGPECMCFCNHRLKCHDLDNSTINKKVKCKESKCKCKVYEYIPVYGANDVKCLCHHSYKEHPLTNNRKCIHNNCKCNKFGSKFTCNCGEGYNTHKTVIQTRDERVKAGKPVEVGWFGASLLGPGLSNIGQSMNDVYETEFKAAERNPDQPKIIYSQGKPINQGNNINQNSNVVCNDNIYNCYDLLRKEPIFFSNTNTMPSKKPINNNNRSMNYSNNRPNYNNINYASKYNY